MFLDCIAIGAYQTNCYIFGDEKTKQAVVIDAGENINNLIDRIKTNGYKIEKILITHGHFDHTNGIVKLKDFTGARTLMCEKDIQMLSNPDCIDGYVKQDDIITIGNVQLRVIETPGHSRGGVCYLYNDILFAGDTLFYQSIGRTDLQGGSFHQIIQSIQEKLLVLPDEVKVYPGHGPATTIGAERRANPYLT